MLNFISIISCNGSVATYHIRLNSLKQYSARLVSNKAASDVFFPPQVFMDKLTVAEYSANNSDIIKQKIALAIQTAELNGEDV